MLLLLSYSAHVFHCSCIDGCSCLSEDVTSANEDFALSVVVCAFFSLVRGRQAVSSPSSPSSSSSGIALDFSTHSISSLDASETLEPRCVRGLSSKRCCSDRDGVDSSAVSLDSGVLVLVILLVLRAWSRLSSTDFDGSVSASVLLSESAILSRLVLFAPSAAKTVGIFPAVMSADAFGSSKALLSFVLVAVDGVGASGDMGLSESSRPGFKAFFWPAF